MSHATADPPATKELDWVFLDEGLYGADTVVYRSVMELRTAPLELSGSKAERFAQAKRTRARRVGTSLSLDQS